MHGIIFGGMLQGFTSDETSIRRSSGGHKIASFLRRNNYNIDVLDFYPSWNPDELKEYVHKTVTTETLFFAFSSTFPLPDVNEFIGWLNWAYPDISIIVGSQNSSMYDVHADWYMYGYGEYAILDLIKHLAGGPEPKHNNKIIDAYHSYPASRMADLTVSYQQNDFMSENEIALIEFSRGCKFKCAFCSFPILGVTEDHTRDAENVYTEMLENYEKWGITNYMVLDETFNDYSEKIEKYANVISKLPFKPNLLGYIRADLLVSRKQDWDNLIAMGFNSHFYGVESFNHASAKSIGKGMNSSKLQDGLLEIKEYFLKNANYYRGQISLIGGLPHETYDTLLQTRDWLFKYWQGQSWHINPLTIQSVSTVDHNSEIDKNWQKFGYRPVKYNPKNEVFENNSYMPHLAFMHKLYSEHDERIMSWQNANMNSFDVLKFISKEFYNDEYEKLSFNEDIFLSDKFVMHPDMDWNKLMHIPYPSDYQQYNLSFIEKYKKLKLV